MTKLFTFKLRLALIPVVLLNCATAAYAGVYSFEFDASKCTRTQIRACISAVVSDPTIQESDIVQIAKVISSVNKLTLHLKQPEKFQLNITYQGSGGGDYSIRENIMNIILHYNNGKVMNSLERTLPLTAHEYGHAIFAFNSPIWAKIQGSPRKPSQKEIDEFSKIFDVDIPYNELFADLVAVLVFKDGQAVYKAISSDEFVANDPEHFYDFEYPRQVKGWTQDEPHRLLDPTRYFLWKEYKALGASAFDEEFVRKFYDAIQTEIMGRLDRNEIELSPEEVNRRLIFQTSKILDQKPHSWLNMLQRKAP